jgi:hypothetical protein
MPNLATLMVGLGYDLSALEKGAPEAFRLINSQTAGMSAEMKRASREGAESFRLVDEALGVHVSRPLTRILTQEFPGFAKGLQSMLGISIAGATGLVAFEGISRLLEQGKKLLEVTGALEGWKQMLGLVGETAEEVAKEMSAADSVLIENLKHKIEMQDAYNQLVLGLKGGDFERAHLELMKQETAELQKQFTAQMLLVQSKASETGWRSAVAQSPLQDVFTALGMGASREVQGQQVEANKLAEAMKPLYDAIKKVNDEIAKANWKIFRDDADAATAAAKAAILDLQGDLKRWNTAADDGWKSWMHTNEELDKALVQLREMGTLAEAADRYQKAKAVNFPQVGSVAPPPGGPQLTDQAELSKVIDDQNEAWKKAGEILNSIESPLQKYQTGMAVLVELEEQGRLTTEQFALAQQKLNEELVQADDHLHKMQEDLQKLLERSTSASAGVQAFFLQMQINSAESGKFTFDLLTQGLKGFEDQLTKLVFDGKAKWKDFFRSLTEEAFKFFLTKGISELFQSAASTGIGKSLGLGGLIPSLGGSGSGATMAAAASTLQAGSSTLLSAATTLQAAATRLSIGSGGLPTGGASIGDLSDSGASSLPDVPGFATGTDDAPGGMAWVGEMGPELLNLPAGSRVTPASALRGGGGDQHFYIDAKGAEIGVEEKIMRALQAARPRFIGEAMANFNEVQKRTPQPRG